MNEMSLPDSDDSTIIIIIKIGIITLSITALLITTIQRMIFIINKRNKKLGFCK